MCNIVDGLEELFFQIAREFPIKIGFKNFASEEIESALIENGIENFHPLDYVKTVQKLFKDSEHSKKIICDLEDSIFTEKLNVLQKKFKILTKEEYDELCGMEKSKDESSNKATLDEKMSEIIKYANNIKFKRNIFRKNVDEDLF